MARVTYAAYEAHGWGVGEVWLDGDRVVSASGIGGYGSLGEAYKRRLLGLDGVAL